MHNIEKIFSNLPECSNFLNKIYIFRPTLIWFFFLTSVIWLNFFKLHLSKFLFLSFRFKFEFNFLSVAVDLIQIHTHKLNMSPFFSSEFNLTLSSVSCVIPVTLRIIIEILRFSAPLTKIIHLYCPSSETETFLISMLRSILFTLVLLWYSFHGMLLSL